MDVVQVGVVKSSKSPQKLKSVRPFCNRGRLKGWRTGRQKGWHQRKKRVAPEIKKGGHPGTILFSP